MWRDAATEDRGEIRTARIRAGLVALVALALSVSALLSSAGKAHAGIECSFDPVTRRLVCRNTTPNPPPVQAPVTTTTTAPPLLNLPPVTLPPIVVPLRPVAPQAMPAAATHLLDLVNGERVRAGLAALSWRDDVAAIAMTHTNSMVAAGDIFHSDSFFSSAVKGVLNVLARGENVAYNGDVDNAHVRLMASPGHRANILDPRFTAAGIAVVLAPDGRYFVTQDFVQAAGAPRTAIPAAPKPAPAPRARTAAAPKPTPPPAPTTTTAAPTTVPPAPAPTVVPDAPAAVLSATSSALEVPADRAPGTGPAAAVALLLLVGCVGACVWVPRRFL